MFHSGFLPESDGPADDTGFRVRRQVIVIDHDVDVDEILLKQPSGNANLLGDRSRFYIDRHGLARCLMMHDSSYRIPSIATRGDWYIRTSCPDGRDIPYSELLFQTTS